MHFKMELDRGALDEVSERSVILFSDLPNAGIPPAILDRFLMVMNLTKKRSVKQTLFQVETFNRLEFHFECN